jgi:hypothetical protein
MAGSRSLRLPAAPALAGLGLIVLLSSVSQAADAPSRATAAPSQAAPAAAPAFDRVATARQAYAGAADTAERQQAAVKLGILLLRRATHHLPPANDRSPAPDSAASPAPPGSAAPTAPPPPLAREDLAEAERLFREVVAGGGLAADEGEGGLLAAMLARGPGGAAAVSDELQRLRQGGRSSGDALLCLAMRDLMSGNHDRETTLAASDLLNEHVHAFLPAAPYLVSHRVSKPERLSAPPPRYTKEGLKFRLRGSVAFQAIIDREGHVADVLVVEPGPFTLTEAATKAVRAWIYRPALLDGKPVPVCFQPAVSFDVQ